MWSTRSFSRTFVISLALSSTLLSYAKTLSQSTSIPADELWHWIYVPGTRCGNDSAQTGIGINLTSRSSKLMIYLEAGGACATSSECKGYTSCPWFGAPAKNMGGYNQTNFNKDMSALYSGQAYGARAIWERPRNTPATVNPFQDYNFVYIPYCTGDLHRGLQTTRSSVTGSVHAGYRNIQLDLAVIKQYFPNPSAVLIIGASAGGFGGLWNYKQIHDTFAPQGMQNPPPVSLIMESGAPIPDAVGSIYYNRQETWKKAWGLSTTSPAGPSVTHDYNVLLWLLAVYQHEMFGFIGSVGDGQYNHGDGLLSMYTVRAYCDILRPQPLTDGFYSLRNQLGSFQNMFFYYPTYNMHGYIHNSHIESTTYIPNPFFPFPGDGMPQRDVFDSPDTPSLNQGSLLDWLRRFAK